MNKSVLAGFAVGTLLSFAVITGMNNGVTDGRAFANESNTYRQLNLFGDVFERVRAAYVEPTDDAKLVDILKKTLRKMDPVGHAAALALPLPAATVRLIDMALK